MKFRSLLFSIIVVALFILSACSNKPENTQHRADNGDLQEVTASLNDLPSFLDDLPDQIQSAYQTAVGVKDVLPWIPCYCGCGENAGHLSNLNCFIKEIKEDGSVIWDDHGTRCGVCMETATITSQMVTDKKSTKEIRTYIDQLYQTGYAKPTPTPFPA